MKSLAPLFEAQAALMEKIGHIERATGYYPPLAPLDFTQRSHHDHFRSMAGYLQEELVEALNAQSNEDYRAEVSDCLHFAIELCLLVGCTPLLSNPGGDDFLGPLDKASIPLWTGINLLKAKPWKQKWEPPNIHALRGYVDETLAIILGVISDLGEDPFEIYHIKNKVNHQRMDTGY